MRGGGGRKVRARLYRRHSNPTTIRFVLAFTQSRQRMFQLMAQACAAAPPCEAERGRKVRARLYRLLNQVCAALEAVVACGCLCNGAAIEHST